MMRMMSCKKDESIIIGGGIVVTVLGIYGDEVHLAVDFPPEVSLQHKEMYDALCGVGVEEEVLAGV